MKNTPCEYIVWNGLPAIRKGLAQSMINDFGLNQNEVADKLGITPAAVSQYLSGKRGHSNFNKKLILKEFKSSAKRIIDKGDEVLISETCRLCRILVSKNLITFNQK